MYTPLDSSGALVSASSNPTASPTQFQHQIPSSSHISSTSPSQISQPTTLASLSPQRNQSPASPRDIQGNSPPPPQNPYTESSPPTISDTSRRVNSVPDKNIDQEVLQYAARPPTNGPITERANESDRFSSNDDVQHPEKHEQQAVIGKAQSFNQQSMSLATDIHNPRTSPVHEQPTEAAIPSSNNSNRVPPRYRHHLTSTTYLPSFQQPCNPSHGSPHSIRHPPPINHNVPQPVAKMFREMSNNPASIQFPLTPPDTPLPPQCLHTSAPAHSAHIRWGSGPSESLLSKPSLLTISSDSDLSQDSSPTSFRDPPYVVGYADSGSTSLDVGPMVDTARTGDRLSPNGEDEWFQLRQREQAGEAAATTDCQQSAPPYSQSRTHSPSFPKQSPPLMATNTRVPDGSVLAHENSHEVAESTTSVARVTPPLDTRLLDNPAILDVLQNEVIRSGPFRLILASEGNREAALCLRGHYAQLFLKRLQMALNASHHDDEEFRRQANRFFLDFCTKCFNIAPLSIITKDVTLINQQPVCGGASADIYRASYRGKEVALKRTRIFTLGSGHLAFHKAFCREASVWQRLTHPFVLPFLGIDSETFSPHFCMVSPWMQNGTIIDHLAINDNVNVGKRVFEVAQGLEYLHSQNIVHGDLRGTNILIDDDWHVRLADFGLSIVCDATGDIFSSTGRGSPRWMSPELHDPELFGLARFQRTNESDVYALACSFLEIYTGLPPFHDIINTSSVTLKVLRAGRPIRPSANSARPMSDELWRLIEWCWSHNPVDRPTIGEVVEIMGQWNGCSS